MMAWLDDRCQTSDGRTKGWTDKGTDGQTDGQRNGRTAGQKDKRMDGQTDEQPAGYIVLYKSCKETTTGHTLDAQKC